MKNPDDLDNVTPIGVAEDPAPKAEDGGDFIGEPPPEDPGAPDPYEPFRHAAKEPTNDFGNGRRFVHHFGQDAMFVPRVGWFEWTGTVWEKDPDELVMRRKAQRLGGLILNELPFLDLSEAEKSAIDGKVKTEKRLRQLLAIDDDDLTEEQAGEKRELEMRKAGIDKILKRLNGRRSRHAQFSNTTGNSTRITNAITEAQTGLAQPLEALDANPMDVNTENGVLRFAVIEDQEAGISRTADVTFLRHDRKMRLTKTARAAYDPKKKCELFDAFFAQIQPDREMRAFLMRWFGVSMTSLTGDQKMAFFYGSGANGKSVLVDVIAKVLGSYAATARIESLTGNSRRGGGDATPDLVPLMGARMVRTSEPDEGQRLQEGLIKELTGGEPLLIRALHSDFVEVKPVFSLTMSGNHKPEIRGTDDGIWRRVMLVPFEVQIPPEERDARLAEKLVAEAPGILNRLVEGLLDYLENGLSPPNKVTAATDEYREESDPIGSFLMSCCVITGDPSDTIEAKRLGEGFNFHLAERGESQWKPTTVSKRIKLASERWKHPHTGLGFSSHKASTMRYLGVRFTETFGRRFDQAPIDNRGFRIPASSSPHPE